VFRKRSSSDDSAFLPPALLLIATLAVAAPIAAAGASELSFQFVNPTFGGNPLNSAHLYGGADRQNQYDDEGSDGSSSGGSGTGDLFARQLESQLYAALAGEITEALFGPNPQQSGTIVFGTQTVTFTRGLTSIAIDIYDSSTGSTTHIEVPII
jgi:curli production assembly/transport component CsgF